MTVTAQPVEEPPRPEEGLEEPASDNDVGNAQAGKKKKKKKKKKNLAERGVTALPKSRGTGFELYYADPPRTAEEAEEEAKLYSPDRPFHDRIEECIQRYRNRRRMDPAIHRHFDSYLFLGGIEASQRQFGGNIDTTDMDAEEVRQATADVLIQRGGGNLKYYTPGEDGWEVDFYTVVAGYLSCLPAETSHNYDEMEKAISVVENFLRYLLHHDVCPEFSEDVQKSIDLCEKARKDLPLVVTAYKQFPGEFNLACMELFLPEAAPLFHDDDGMTFRRPENFNPDVVFKMGLLSNGIRSFDSLLSSEGFEVDREEELDLEIVAIHHPDEKARELYKGIAVGKNGKKCQPVGCITVKECYIEDGWWKGDGAAEKVNPAKKEFFLDGKILSFLQKGMKLRVLAGDLCNNVSFIIRVSAVLVPWYTFLPQILMRIWKDPSPDYRPARSVYDPPMEDDLVDLIDPCDIGELNPEKEQEE